MYVLIDLQNMRIIIHTGQFLTGHIIQVFKVVNNYKVKHAVAILKDDVIVGHVPFNLSPRLFQFYEKRSK